MIDQDRNLGVTEARFGLTLLILLLGAVGFVVLMRLGGASGQTAEIGPAEEVVQGGPHDVTTPERVEQQPQVLPIEPQEVRDTRGVPNDLRRDTATSRGCRPYSLFYRRARRTKNPAPRGFGSGVRFVECRVVRSH